jgi:hypothetical protein
MRSITRLLAIVATIVALTVLAPVAAAGTQRGLHIDKTCSGDLSEPFGYICTLQHSDFRWFPAGTDVHYLSQVGNVVQVRIEIANGSTEGSCTWSSAVDAICLFNGGTGRLTQFHLDVVVTANTDQSIWYWDGTYWFGG